MDDFSFYDCSSSFRFLLIEFHCTFPFLLKCYHIMYIIIVSLLILRNDTIIGRRDCFFSCPLYFFVIHASLLTYIVGFRILFHSCCFRARVSVKTLVHEFPIPIAILNGTFFFV